MRPSNASYPDLDTLPPVSNEFPAALPTLAGLVARQVPINLSGRIAGGHVYSRGLASAWMPDMEEKWPLR
jgi:hypothetical protein